MVLATHPVRRALAALAVAGAGLAANLGLGAAPAGAIDAEQCLGAEARAFVCGSYRSFVDRTPSPAEVDYWAPLLPAKTSFFLATLGRSPESRALIVEDAYWAYADRLVSQGEVSYWVGEILRPDGFRRLQAALYNEFAFEPEELVDWAFYGIVGRAPTAGDVEYWAGVAEDRGQGRMADLLAGTLEVRRTRVRFTYLNELGHEPDTAGRDHWAERLRTGTSYLDLRIALKASGYPGSSGVCSSLTPPARPECVD